MSNLQLVNLNVHITSYTWQQDLWVWHDRNNKILLNEGSWYMITCHLLMIYHKYMEHSTISLSNGQDNMPPLSCSELASADVHHTYYISLIIFFLITQMQIRFWQSWSKPMRQQRNKSYTTTYRYISIVISMRNYNLLPVFSAKQLRYRTT